VASLTVANIHKHNYIVKTHEKLRFYFSIKYARNLLFGGRAHFVSFNNVIKWRKSDPIYAIQPQPSGVRCTN